MNESLAGLIRQNPGIVEAYVEAAPREYWNTVKELNKFELREIGRDFAGVPIDPRTTCIVVVGSDGKLERHAQSRTEIVVLHRPSSKLAQERDMIEIPQRIVDWYNRVHPKEGEHYEESFDLSLSDVPEIKILNDAQLPLAYASPHLMEVPPRIFPDRVLNTVILTPQASRVYFDARRQVILEMASFDHQAGYIRTKMKQQLKEYRRAAQTGEYRGQSVFRVDDSVLTEIYDEAPDSRATGFKVPFLRTVQRYMDLLTTRLVLDSSLDLNTVVCGLPMSTIDRLKFFRRHDLFPEGNPAEQIDTVIDAYAWFLQAYHFVQEGYKHTRALAEISFSGEQFLDFWRLRESILNFSDLSNLPKVS